MLKTIPNIVCFVLFTTWNTEDPDFKCFNVLDIVPKANRKQDY